MKEVCNTDFLHSKQPHVLRWNEYILFFGEKYCDPNHVQILHNGKWQCKKTSGIKFFGEFRSNESRKVIDVCLITAQVVWDKMYVFTHSETPLSDVILVLDLPSWTWAEIIPKGNAPIICNRGTMWVHGNKIYSFGGHWRGDLSMTNTLGYHTGLHESLNIRDFNRTNQLFCYDTSTNTFEWPFNNSNLPSPRSGQSSFLHGNLVFIFGGKDAEWRVNNELQILDLANMKWMKIHDNMIGDKMPHQRAYHSLTRISDGKAILYGGCDADWNRIEDCWILHYERAIKGQFTEPSALWSKVVPARALNLRYYHDAIIEPNSGRLYIVGGRSTVMSTESTSKTLVLSFTPASLEFLAMESIVN